MSSSSSSTMECYIPPMPNVTKLTSLEYQITSPSYIPEGYTLTLLLNDLTNNDLNIIVEENIGTNESFLLSDKGIELELQTTYSLVWKPIES